MKQKLLFIGLVLLLICSLPTIVTADSEREKVIAVAQKFLDTLVSRNVEDGRSVLMADSVYYSVRDSGIKGSTLIASVESLATGEAKLYERMWDQKVMIHDKIAMVWTPYDFHVNGGFSHCGVDIFSLVKTVEGWKIAGLIYTVEKTGCKESPLGPLQ